jgi:hypothetical protein
MIPLLAALAVGIGGDPSIRPWPIGPGPAYLPAAAARHGEPVAGHACVSGGRRFQVHLELYANRRVVIVPPGIGIARGCSYPARTRTPTGVVEVARGSSLDLGDLFRIWGQPLGTYRLASFRSATPVRAYVAGRRVRGPVAAVRLRPNAEIVLELGAYVPPHRFFLFPKGSQ